MSPYLYLESYQPVGIKPSKSAHFIVFPVTSSFIFASKFQVLIYSKYPGLFYIGENQSYKKFLCD
jgi:hypothetical protein